MENEKNRSTPLEKLKKFISKFSDIYDCIDLTLLVRYLAQVGEKQDKDITKLKIERIINKKDHDELMARLKHIDEFLTKKYGTKKESN